MNWYMEGNQGWARIGWYVISVMLGSYLTGFYVKSSRSLQPYNQKELLGSYSLFKS